MTSFFKALRDAKEPDGDGQKVLKVPVEQPELLDKLQLSRRHGATELNFLLRKEYEQLVEQMQVCAKRGAIVVGTSGIGKSAFRFYVMRQWLKGHEKLPKARFPKVLFNFGRTFFEMDVDGTVNELPTVHFTTCGSSVPTDWRCLTPVSRLQAWTRACISISCS